MPKQLNEGNLEDQSQKRARLTLQEIEVNSANQPNAQPIQKSSSKVSSIAILLVLVEVF
jgi:hypothetical protein